jgi:hypothetical protein
LVMGFSRLLAVPAKAAKRLFPAVAAGERA